ENTAVVPPAPQVPLATRPVPVIPNEIDLTRTAPPHPFPAEEAAMAPGFASADHDAPASELVSTVPSLSSAARCAPSAANASGEAATAASIGPPGDQEAPPSAVCASGENTRSWLGRTATVSDFAPPAAATSPPLSATPGGVTSFHEPEFPVLAKTSQKGGSAAIGTTAQVSLPAAIDVAIEAAPGAPAAPEAAEDAGGPPEPQAARASALATAS